MYYLVIPAYEPDNKLLALLEDVYKHLDCHVLIINDGSSHQAKAIFEQAERYGTIIHHKRNLGKGQALRTAFQYIHDRNQDTVIVTADADGQHAVADIDRVAQAAKHLPNQLILGVRQFSNDIPLRSQVGNKLTRLLFKLQTGVAVSDTQTGLRAFQSSMIPFMLGISGNRYEYEMNMLTSASQRYTITEIPIQTIYIDDNESSHFRPIRDSLLIYKNLFQFALSSFSGFLIDYLVYAVTLLTLAGAPTIVRLFLANSLSRVTSSVCNYNLNKLLVFKNKDSNSITGPAYFALVVALFICDTTLLYVFHKMLGLNLYWVKIAVGILLFFVSWFVQKQFIFKERKTLSHEISL
ncbi:glycosyltransferase [Streptococcus cameli]